MHARHWLALTAAAASIGFAGFVVSRPDGNGSASDGAVRQPQTSSRITEPAIPLQAASAESKLALTFGVYSFKKPTEVYKEFEPAIDELRQNLEITLGRAVEIEITVAKTYEDALSAFVAGKVDFVRFGPASYVMAKQAEPGVQLLVAEEEGGQKRCKGVFVVRKGCDIQSLADLKGKRVAFGDDKSTIGRYLAQAELIKAGIHAADLAEFKYFDRHDNVFKTVEIGDFDAGAVHIATFEQLNKDGGKLRVVASFDNVGKPWIARAGLDSAVVAALRKSLLQLKCDTARKALGVDGFMTTVDTDYDFVRAGMKKSQEFGDHARGEPVEPAAQPPPAKGR